MKLNSLSYLASILLLLFCFLLQLISALQPVSLSTPTHVELALKTPNVVVDLKRRRDNLTSLQNESDNKTKQNTDGNTGLPLPPSKKDDITVTEIDVTLTTTIYGSAQPTIHNASNTAAARQQQQQQPPQQATSSVGDPNGESLKSKLEEDQEALRRMIMILSLVGGLGVVAVVATVVIFTRMRARNRKQREIEEGNEGSTYELSGGMDQHSETSISPDSTYNSSNAPPSHNSDDNDDDNDPDQHVEPSAPPALMMVTTTEGSSSSLHNNTEQRRRHIVSMLSQTTAPSPSAPTAKELDAMIDEEASQQQQQPTTSSHSYLEAHSHSSYGSSRNHTMCEHCSPLMTPEPPPPAYTPSAPPHYALPVEPVIVEQINHEEPSSVISPRRHSLGS